MIDRRCFAIDDDAVLPAWTALVGSDPDATVFHLPAYVRACASVGAPARRRVDLIERDGTPIGLLTLVVERQGSPTGPIEVVRFVDGHALPGPAGPLAAPADRREVADAWVAAMVEAADWDELILSGLPASTGWAALLADAGRRHRLLAVTDAAGGAGGWRVALPGDGTLPLSPRAQWSSRRRRRKLTRELGAVEIRETPSRLLADGLERFLALASRGQQHPWRGEVQVLLRHLGVTLGDAKILRLHELLAAGQPVAAAVSLVGASEWAVVATALDPVLRRYTPEALLVAELLQSAADDGCAAVDVLPGVTSDPSRFGAEERNLLRCHIVRSR